FLDDIDVLFESVSAPDDVVRLHPVVAQILVEIDKLQAMSGVVVLAATSRADRLSFEFVRSGRFDFTVTLPLPDALARKKILQIHARKLPLAADIDFDHLAGLTQGMTPAEIAALCNRVGLMALQQAQGEGSSGVIPPVVNAELFEQLLRGRKN
ncbi:MAG: AAA family ATPase, partial [Alphaproteobacteria bacterium]|nr:AAA family ATPase [Alphaproteobacteria bacterium]